MMIRGNAAAAGGYHLRSLDQTARSHTWKKDLKKAGTGPEEFRELRAKAPRHPR